MLPLETGAAAVRFARAEAEAEVLRSRGRGRVPGELAEPRGAFVTLVRGDVLRGCVGSPEAAPLHEVLARSARGAVRDPRFEPVRPSELAEMVVEVSVLRPPVALAPRSPEELPGLVRVGDHGLSLAAGRRRALLLPQVALEHGLDAEGFLAACCAKAGLDPAAWLEGQGLRWSVFEADVFQEEGPRGAVTARRRDRPEVA